MWYSTIFSLLLIVLPFSLCGRGRVWWWPLPVKTVKTWPSYQKVNSSPGLCHKISGVRPVGCSGHSKRVQQVLEKGQYGAGPRGPPYWPLSMICQPVLLAGRSPYGSSLWMSSTSYWSHPTSFNAPLFMLSFFSSTPTVNDFTTSSDSNQR